LFDLYRILITIKEPSWPGSYGSWIYNYQCNQCLPPLMLWVWISIRARCTTLCDNVCKWLETGRWFSSDPPVFSTNKTDLHNITEILLNTIKQTNNITINSTTELTRSHVHVGVSLLLCGDPLEYYHPESRSKRRVW